MFKRAMYAPEGGDGGQPAPEDNTDPNTGATPPPATPPAGDPPQPSPEDNPAGNGGDDTPDFTVPDEYKDAPWASKVKSEDDLWKQLDNTQRLLGRKHATPDFKNATPQEIEQYFNEVRPENAEAYAFAPPDSEDYETTDFDKAVGEALFNAGINEHQGNMAIQAFREIMTQQQQAMYDKDAFMDDMEAFFGHGFETKMAQTKEFIEGNMNAAQKEQFEGLSNAEMGLVYQIANNMLKAYGASETNAGGKDNPGPNTGPTLQEQQKAVRKELDDLTKDPMHTSEKKTELVQKLHQLKQQEIAQRQGKR